MSDKYAELYERSKDDRAIIVGSEIREVIGDFNRAEAKLAAIRALCDADFELEVPLWSIPTDGIRSILDPHHVPRQNPEKAP